MRIENLDDAIRLRRDLESVDGTLNAIAGGSLGDALAWFEGNQHSVVKVLGEENYRAAVRPALQYTRSQIIANLNALGIEVE